MKNIPSGLQTGFDLRPTTDQAGKRHNKHATIPSRFNTF